MWNYSNDHILIYARRLTYKNDISGLRQMAEDLQDYADPRILFEFAYMCKQENYARFMYNELDVLGRTICELNNPEYIIQYAKDIAYNKDRYQDAIIRIGKAEYIYEFAKQVPKANLKVLTKAIILCDDPQKVEYMKKFAELPGVDKKGMEYYINMYSKQEDLNY